MLYAIPNHPWIDSAEGAAVRIAVTVAAVGKFIGKLDTVLTEDEKDADGYGVVLTTANGEINADLSVGASLARASELKANQGLSGQGVIVLGEGFILTEAEREILSQTEPKSISLIKQYMNGKDIVQRSRNLFIIDLHGLQESDLMRHPSIYQRIRDRVRPIRLEMKDKQRREKWWLFGR